MLIVRKQIPKFTEIGDLLPFITTITHPEPPPPPKKRGGQKEIFPSLLKSKGKVGILFPPKNILNFKPWEVSTTPLAAASLWPLVYKNVGICPNSAGGGSAVKQQKTRKGLFEGSTAEGYRLLWLIFSRDKYFANYWVARRGTVVISKLIWEPGFPTGKMPLRGRCC